MDEIKLEQHGDNSVQIAVNEGEVHFHFPASTSKPIRNDVDRFAEAYEKDVLFLEGYAKTETKISLSDLFVAPSVEFTYEGTQFDNVPNVCMRNNIIIQIEKFGSQDGFSVDDFAMYNYNSMIVLGLPGIGKSSILQKIASDYKNGKCFVGKKLYCFRLRDLADWDINVQAPLESIISYANLEPSDLEGAVLLLDGLDELCGINCMENSIDTFCKNLMKKSSKKLKIIVTSRLNYININLDYYPHTVIAKLLPFDISKRERWIKKYKKSHRTADDTVAANIISFSKMYKEAEEENEFLGMPLSLYIIMSLKIDLDGETSLSSIYDRMIEQLKKRQYDENQHSLIGQFDYEEIVKSIAHLMFIKDKYVLNSDEVNGIINIIAHNRNLSVKDISRIGKLYGMSFYFKEGISQRSSVEFIHRTLSDYVVAWKIFDDLKPVLNDIDNYWKTIDGLLGMNEVSPEIVDFFVLRLEREGNKTKNAFVKAFKDYFPILLQGGMLFQSDRTINALEKASHIFYGYWRIMKNLSPETDFLNKENVELINAALFIKSLYQHRRYSLNFSFQIAKHIDFQGTDFSNGNFTYADLEQSNFSLCVLESAIFDNANLKKSNFNGSGGSNVSFVNTIISDSIFTDADFQEAVFSNIEIDGSVEFDHTTLSKSMFIDVKLTDVNLENASIEYSEFQNAEMIRTVFPKSSIPVSLKLRNCRIVDSILNEIVFSDCTITDTHFDDTDFSHSDIRKLFGKQELETCVFSNMGNEKFIDTVMTQYQADWFIKRGIITASSNIISPENDSDIRILDYNPQVGGDENE